jgi:hypothetical protein
VITFYHVNKFTLGRSADFRTLGFNSSSGGISAPLRISLSRAMMSFSSGGRPGDEARHCVAKVRPAGR